MQNKPLRYKNRSIQEAFFPGHRPAPIHNIVGSLQPRAKASGLYGSDSKSKLSDNIAAEIDAIAKSGSLSLKEQEEIKKELESHFHEKTRELMLSSKEELIEDLALKSFGSSKNLGKMFFTVNYPYLQIPVLGPILQVPVYRLTLVCLVITLFTNILALFFLIADLLYFLPIFGQLIFVIFALVNKFRFKEFIAANAWTVVFMIFMLIVLSILGFVNSYAMLTFLMSVVGWLITNVFFFVILSVPGLIIKLVKKLNGK